MGLVPMSPNTTPSAPSSRAAPAGWAAAAGVETAAGEILSVVLLGMAGLFRSGRARRAAVGRNASDVSQCLKNRMRILRASRLTTREFTLGRGMLLQVAA